MIPGTNSSRKRGLDPAGDEGGRACAAAAGVLRAGHFSLTDALNLISEVCCGNNRQGREQF